MHFFFSEFDFEKFMKKHELVLNKIIKRQPDIIFSVSF